MPAKTIIYTWEQFDEDCIRLAKEIRLGKRDVLVAIKAIRIGGMLLAKMVGHLKRADNRVFDMNYAVQEIDGKIRMKLIGHFHPGLANRHALLFTDKLQSGVFVGKAKTDLMAHNTSVRIVTIHAWQDSPIRPDVCLYGINRATNVVYPWDKGQD